MKKYLITDPEYYTNDLKEFQNKLENKLKNKKTDIACFRDKKSKNVEELAKIFVNVCKKNNINTILLNSDYKLAHKLGAHGVHLNSKQFDEIQEAKKLNLITIISCHTENEIQKAIELSSDMITYSPIFNTPNKGEAKGIELLKKVVKTYPKTKIIALGGIIKDSQIQEIKEAKAYGFASIRYFI